MSVSVPSDPPVLAPLSEEEQSARLIRRLRKIEHVDTDDIRLVRAPLRICPLGAHIDHQLGIVTGMTIDRSVLMAFAPTANGSVHLESLNFPIPARFSLSDVPAYHKGDWANYARGAVLALQQKYHLARGMAGVIGGTMPIGGLSSSAAVTIAYLLALPIGWNREKEERSAGIRTFPLVAVASCGFIQAAEARFGTEPEAMARIMEGLITGMGFIGGGAILRLKDSVKGTATAASLWVTGAIGVSAGLQAYDVAVMLSIITLITLWVLSPLKRSVIGDIEEPEKE